MRLAAQTTGRLTAVYAADNRHVHKGDLLATIESETPAATFQDAKSNDAQADALGPATKYGALIVDHGLVHITWSLTESALLSLTWVERGGPEVKAPTRKGFGTRLIQSGSRAQSGDKVDFSFDPEGVMCTIVAPL